MFTTAVFCLSNKALFSLCVTFYIIQTKKTERRYLEEFKVSFNTQALLVKSLFNRKYFCLCYVCP